jgi:hypothetical protein
MIYRLLKRGLGFIDVEKSIYNFYALEDPKKSLKASWTTPSIEHYPDILDEGKNITNFISYRAHFACDEKTRSILQTLIGQDVEFLPLYDVATAQNYYLIRILRVIECLDHSQSEFEYSRSSDSVKRVKKYVFPKQCLEPAHIFRIPELNYSLVYVSTTFKELVETHKLTGIECQELNVELI